MKQSCGEERPSEDAIDTDGLTSGAFLCSPRGSELIRRLKKIEGS